MIINTIVNNDIVSLNLPSGAVTLDVIRNQLHLKGTKEGCREGDCGSCMILLGKPNEKGINYKIVNSCLLPIIEVANSHIVTIEGLNGAQLSPIQENFVQEGASQCGFCTPGFIISITGYLLHAKTLQIDDAIAFLSGNICRCTGYKSIIRATENVLNAFSIDIFENSYHEGRIEYLVEKKILPEYFLNIPEYFNQLPYPNHQPYSFDDEIRPIAGGTDLYVQKGYDLEDKEINPIDINEQFKKIIVIDNRCYIGAAVTITELSESKTIRQIIPQFAKYAQLISCTSIRNRATVGGNIVNASPIGDLSVLLLVLNASLLIENKTGNREIPIGDFFKAYKQFDLKKDEWLSAIILPCCNQRRFFNFEKVSKRTHLDIASVNSAFCIEIENNIIVDIKISAGGVSPVPLLLNETCKFLKGKTLKKEVIDDSLLVLSSEICPISDVRGSASYKSLLLKQLVESHFERLNDFLNIKPLCT